jgi:hypothetical protein
MFPAALPNPKAPSLLRSAGAFLRHRGGVFFLKPADVAGGVGDLRSLALSETRDSSDWRHSLFPSLRSGKEMRLGRMAAFCVVGL